MLLTHISTLYPSEANPYKDVLIHMIVFAVLFLFRRVYIDIKTIPLTVRLFQTVMDALSASDSTAERR